MNGSSVTAFSEEPVLFVGNVPGPYPVEGAQRSVGGKAPRHVVLKETEPNTPAVQ